MNNILVIGGTGAMGAPLVKKLSINNNVYVTSRSKHESTENIQYLHGNAKDESFLKQVLSERHWDAIVDFMIWTTEFAKVMPLMLDSTDQYVFISSARVYAQTEDKITESTPRLLDVSEDEDYLKTNEYALSKAKEENLLYGSQHCNYTIIRPSITYNNYRLQLGVLEKENWLYRALHGRSIVFSNDIVNKLTTMTLGDDVALGIASIVGQPSAIGKTFHITYTSSLQWKDVLNIYCSVLEKHLGHSVKVIMTERCLNLELPSRRYQVLYSRYYNRTFDNSRIGLFCDVQKFTSPYQGLANCLASFLQKPMFSSIDWALEALHDRAANERTPLSEIPGRGNRISYLSYRYNLRLIKRILQNRNHLKNKR